MRLQKSSHCNSIENRREGQKSLGCYTLRTHPQGPLLKSSTSKKFPGPLRNVTTYCDPHIENEILWSNIPHSNHNNSWYHLQVVCTLKLITSQMTHLWLVLYWGLRILTLQFEEVEVPLHRNLPLINTGSWPIFPEPQQMFHPSLYYTWMPILWSFLCFA